MDMTAYRPVTADHRPQFEEVLQHAFAIEQGPASDSPGGETDWLPALSRPRGVFDGDRLVSVCKLYFLDAFLHDEFVQVGGIGGVATPPQHRRNGHIRTLATSALEEYREAGVSLVALWPFDTGFYHHLGWGVANKYTTYEIPPEQLAFGRGADGAVRRLSPDDWERLRPVEVADGEGTHLSLRRSETWWRERTLGEWPGDTAPYIYGYERDGELQGYVLYTVSSGDDGRELDVRKLAHIDTEAYHALLGFLSDHDSQVESITLRRAAETELLDLVENPGRVGCTVNSGPMVRLTDVRAGLEQYPWPDGFEQQFTLGVTDPLLDRNDGLFDVTVAAGESTVEPLDKAARRSPADVTTNVATLSQLYLGAYTLSEAEQFGELTVDSAPLRRALADGFTGYPVCLREFF